MIYPKSLMVKYTGEGSVQEWKELVSDPSRSECQIKIFCNLEGHQVIDKRVYPWIKFLLS